MCAAAKFLSAYRPACFLDVLSIWNVLRVLDTLPYVACGLD